MPRQTIVGLADALNIREDKDDQRSENQRLLCSIALRLSALVFQLAVLV